MKLHIEKLIKRKKEGKYGEYINLAIRSNNKWYSAYGGRWNDKWQEGQTVNVWNVQETHKDGKTYYNIKAPNLDDVMERLEALEAKINGTTDPREPGEDEDVPPPY